MLHILRPLPMPVAALSAGAALAPITITSSATFSAAENQTAVATLAASGGTGSFTWTKIGGADTAKFTLTSGGVLTFASAPDFETPTDADLNNVYLVQVQVADGVSTPATQNISVTVTDVGGEVWTPAQLATLKGWYKGDALTGADNSAVSSWPDSSGLANNATATNSPTLQTAEQNSLNVVQLTSASSQYFTLPNLLSGASACAAVLVLKATGSGDSQGGPLKIGSDVTNNGNNHYPYFGNDIYDDFGSTGRQGLGAVGAGVASWHIASFHSAASNWKYYKNGVVGFSTTTNTVGLRSTPKIGQGAKNGLDSLANYFGGMIGEIVIVNEFLSDADRQKAEGYLAHKWWGAGALNPLDSGHPYKTTPP